MSILLPEPTRQTAPAPHFPQTEILPGPVVNASCPCGWRKIASSHAHSVTLGKEHLAEVAAAGRAASGFPELDF